LAYEYGMLVQLTL